MHLLRSHLSTLSQHPTRACFFTAGAVAAFLAACGGSTPGGSRSTSSSSTTTNSSGSQGVGGGIISSGAGTGGGGGSRIPPITDFTMTEVGGYKLGQAVTGAGVMDTGLGGTDCG